MKKIIITSFILCISLISFAQERVTRTFTVGEFDSIDAAYVFEVEVTKGRQCSVVIEAEPEVMSQLQVNVRGNELNLSINNAFWRIIERSWKKDRKVIAKITMPELVSVDLSAASSLITKDNFSPKNMSVDLSGASSANLNIMSHTMDVEVSGASTLNLYGLSTKAEVEVSGASKFNMEQDVDNIQLEVSGASEATLNGSTGSAHIEISGASELEALKFQAETMDLKCSGASNVHVFVSKTMGVTATGASNVYVKGNPAFAYSVIKGASSVKSL